MTIRGADEYQLMVEHFAECICGSNTQLAFASKDIVDQMRVLDTLGQAARSGVVLQFTRYQPLIDVIPVAQIRRQDV
ncbi:MAG: hypothetical protein M0C28_36270 [Candidatus Moduliflexus flocculans]|nr:hypothetical protein [Candidatus Moduliflexus flocculans]